MANLPQLSLFFCAKKNIVNNAQHAICFLTIIPKCDTIKNMRRKYTKRCPRCDTKNDYSAYRCSSCGLIFSRVETGSNKLAKQLILAGKRDETVKARQFPKDVNKKKFLLLCGFLGLWGAHNFYVGRFVKAIYQLVCGMVAVIMVVVGPLITNLNTIMSFVSIPIGVDAIFWAWDFIDGILNRYRIPVAVDFLEGDKK